ncbi:MAG: PAS domain S-box protein [Pyrinomonadaceae bacterium]
MKDISSNKIVAINDAPDQMELLAVILRDAGYRVLTAESAAEGLKIARRELPDLIVSDVMMPETDGIELCRMIRADEKLNTTPILLVSALRKDAANVIEGLKSGADDYIEAPYDPLNLAARASRLIERKRMEDVLRASENRFRSLIENSSDIISILAPDGTILYESPSIETALGYTPEELINKNAFDLIHPEDLAKTLAYFEHSITRTETVQTVEYRFRHKDNSWRIIESVGRQFDDPANGLVGIVNSRDVTNQRKALQSQRESESRFRIIFDNAATGMAMIDTQGHLVQTNAALEQMLGYTDEDMRQLSFTDFTHPDDAAGNMSLVQRVFAGELDSFRVEKRYIKKNGEIMWGNLTVSAIRLSGVENHFLIGMVEDITDRKRTDAALRESEERFRTQYKGIPIPTCTWKKIGDDFVLVDFNDAAVEITNGEISGLLGTKASEMYGEAPEILEDYNRCFNEKSVVKRETLFNFVNTGDVKHLDITCVFIPSDIVMVHYRDVTAQLEAEEMLRKSEERFQLAARATNDALWDWNLSTNSIWYSDACYKLLGREPKEGESHIQLWTNAIHPDDKERVKKNSRAIIKSKENYWMDEYRLCSADGSYAYILDRGYIIYEDGEPVRMIGAALNITERKLAEQALQTNQARLQKQNKVLEELTKRHKLFHIPLQTAIKEITETAAQIIETSRVSVWLYNDDKSMMKAIDLYELNENRHFEGFELTKSDYPKYFEALAKEEAIAAHDAHTDPRTGEFLESYLAPLNITSILDIPIRMGGQVVGIVCHEHIGDAREWKLDEQNFAGSMASLISLLLEANERQQAEEALLKSREHLTLAQQIAGIGSFELNLRTRTIVASSELKSLYGIPATASVDKFEDWEKYIHPEDLPVVKREMDAALAKGEFNMEFRLIRSDGSLRWIYAIGRVFHDENGAPSRLVGVNMDITGRKQNEDSLRESERRFRQLIELSPDAVMVHCNGKIIFHNSACAGLFGASNPSQINGQTMLDFLHEDCREFVIERIERILEGEKAPFAEEKYIRLDGAVIDVEVSGTPFVYNNMKAVLVVARDITERKEAEKAIGEANERAIREYDRLLQRLSTLAQKSGAARDLATIFSALLDFALASVPCSALFISLYDEEKGVRKAIYLWYNGKESDVSGMEPVRVGDGHAGRAIKSGEVTIINDFLNTRNIKTTYVHLGFDEDEREPRSTIVAPMKMMGKVIGAIEVQSYEPDAYAEEHASAMRMAANIAANAIENVRLFEQEQNRAEQLRQSQKLESVGRLAGGIAHDFNNMLTAINGYSDLTLRRLGEDDPLRKNIQEIKKAGERSAALTNQLLAFSRRQVLKPKVVDINHSIVEISMMLKRLLGEDVQLITNLSPKLGRVEADPGQLTQVIMNLAVNARDAMPDGGELTIETANVYLDEDYAARHISARAGSFVVVSVSDRGTGMDKETLQHIFEPFYTTKEMGKGTGLGLATVYGIVKQSGGYIWVYSEPDEGTIFKIYLPRIDEKAEASDEISVESEKVLNRTGTILLVEDEEIVRNLSRQILETCGYTVIEASNGAEALAFCEQPDSEIDLVVTDVVMPKMSGRQLAERLAVLRPGIKVLYMSGYTDDAIVRQGIIETGSNFIQKPFTFNALAGKVEELLDAKAK